jgi:hypothetical protein
MRRRMERIHLALCRLFVAQKRAMERGAPRIDYWGDLDTQQGDAHVLRPSFMDMANAFDELLANE